MYIDKGPERTAASDVDLTPATVRILRALLQDPEEPHYVSAMMEAAKVLSSTIYRELTYLERAQWITCVDEDIDPEREQRPPRRGYLLTREGARLARLAIAEYDDRPPRGGKGILARLLRPALASASSAS